MRMRFVCLVLIFPLLLVPLQAQEVSWTSWANKDVSSLSNDNTGASFAISSDVLSPAGRGSLQVIPGGTADETKLAFTLSGADLADWETYSQLELDVFLPEENNRNANRFFLGLADVSDGFVWKDGVFGDGNLSTGWNRILFRLLPAMRSIESDATYTIFFSFFHEDSGGKTPLSEPFYLGEIYLSGAESQANQNAEYQAEVDALLAMDDSVLLDAIARESFDFFWLEANPENGLIRDRSRADSPASIAAVGFGLSAITIGVDRGWISHEEGYERALTTLETFANGGVQGEHGFFYHFVDMETGERAWSSEVSSIDSTLFIVGALTAGQYFAGTEVETLANQLYEQMDWQWFMAGRSTISMAWKPETGFLSAYWNHFDESLLLYVMAIASPTHPAPVSMWDEMDRPVYVTGEYIYLSGEPLFVYQYPLAYLDLRNQEDAYANYFNNTTRACERNRQFSADHVSEFATYENGVWGLSASDGPHGYRAYGASLGDHDGTIAPYASISCLPFTPEASMESIRAMLNTYGADVWGEYGFVSAINASEDWYSTEHIGIDQGDMLLMIANYQDEFVWNLFMQNQHVQEALVEIGFVPSEGDYAVTPAYLESRR